MPPPPIPLFEGPSLRVRRAGRRLRLRPSEACPHDLFKRLPHGEFSYLQVAPEELFGVEASGCYLRLLGPFGAPARARAFEVGPLPEAEADAAATALNAALKLPRTFRAVDPERLRARRLPRGRSWVVVVGVRRRAHPEGPDFEGCSLDLYGEREPPFDVPLEVRGRLVIPGPYGPNAPPPVGWHGPRLAVLEVRPV